jgi:hypothetical protein
MARLTVNYSDADDAAIAQIMEDLSMSKNAVFRKGLQMMALYAKQKAEGGAIAVKNADGTYQDLIIL